MSISASNGLMAVVMSNSSAVGIEKVGRNARRPHFSGCGLLENVAEFSYSAVSSDMAQPIIVAGATTERCAAVGPVQVHPLGHTADRRAMSRDTTAVGQGCSLKSRRRCRADHTHPHARFSP